MTREGRDRPDTDWHVARLYEFAGDLDATVIVANYSRYVVDLNRPGDDSTLYDGQVATGICPRRSFAGIDLYEPGRHADDEEQSQRVHTFWQPYHRALQSTLEAGKAEHGYALLWDAHSIPSRVPGLFDGELPELNIGTYSGRSCDEDLAAAVVAVATNSDYSSVENGRFIGGFITRHHGQPGDDVHAIQLEIAQRAYMDEASREYDESKAAKLRDTLTRMIEAYVRAAERKYR
ncbi:MAG: N-formylglutamate amidohydrolase [Woeseiaceae bacterium]